MVLRQQQWNKTVWKIDITEGKDEETSTLLQIADFATDLSFLPIFTAYQHKRNNPHRKHITNFDNDSILSPSPNKNNPHLLHPK